MPNFFMYNFFKSTGHHWNYYKPYEYIKFSYTVVQGRTQLSTNMKYEVQTTGPSKALNIVEI